MKHNEIKLQKVYYMPPELEEGILYVSKEFGIAGHLCACGCGNKVMTLIGGAEWSIKINKNKVSVWPSIGNGQLPCKSHYLISNNKIIWCAPIDDDMTALHLKKAANKRNDYYQNLHGKRFSLTRLKIWIKSIIKKLFD